MNRKVMEVLADYQARLDQENPLVAEFTAEEYLEKRDESTPRQ